MSSNTLLLLENDEDHKTLLKAPEVPYVVAKCQTLGRYLVAAKDLFKGEIILEELPLAAAPQKNSPLICPGCFITCTTIQCIKCGWPICGINCPGTHRHAVECKILSAKCESREAKKDNKSEDDWILLQDCLMVIRCLSLKTLSKENWKELMNMETNWDQWASSALYENAQNLLSTLRTELGVSQQEHSDEEIMTLLAILDINAYEVKMSDVNVQGCYKLASLAEHSCMPNALKTTSRESLVLTLRAVTDISKGSHIATTYCDVLLPTFQRQRYIQWSKFFVCKCQRCYDPTELGSNISSLLCPKCPIGTPLFPLLEPKTESSSSSMSKFPMSNKHLLPIVEAESEDEENVVEIWTNSTSKDYHCLRCDTRYPATSCESLLVTAESQLQELDKECSEENISNFESWLDQWTISPAAKNPVNYYNGEYDDDNKITSSSSRGGRYAQQPQLLFLHPQHAFCLDACHTVFFLYSAQTSTTEELQRKEILGNHLLNATSSLLTGISMFRGTIMHELSMTKAALFARYLEEEEDNSVDLKALAKDTLSLLSEALDILKYESEDQPEGKLFILGLKQMEEIEHFLKATIPDL